MTYNQQTNYPATGFYGRNEMAENLAEDKRIVVQPLFDGKWGSRKNTVVAAGTVVTGVFKPPVNGKQTARIQIQQHRGADKVLYSWHTDRGVVELQSQTGVGVTNPGGELVADCYAGMAPWGFRVTPGQEAWFSFCSADGGEASVLVTVDFS